MPQQMESNAAVVCNVVAQQYSGPLISFLFEYSTHSILLSNCRGFYVPIEDDVTCESRLSSHMVLLLEERDPT